MVIRLNDLFFLPPYCAIKFQDVSDIRFDFFEFRDIPLLIYLFAEQRISVGVVAGFQLYLACAELLFEERAGTLAANIGGLCFLISSGRVAIDSMAGWHGF